MRHVLKHISFSYIFEQLHPLKWISLSYIFKILHTQLLTCLCSLSGFFNHLIITVCDWLVKHVIACVFMLVTYNLTCSLFALVIPLVKFKIFYLFSSATFCSNRCIQCVMICRVGLYASFCKIYHFRAIFRGQFICQYIR